MKEFPEMYEVTWEPGIFPWYIRYDVPYMKEFPQKIPVNQRPLNPDIWYINTNIPYKHEFPPLLAVDHEPGVFSWYISSEIPYMKEFPTLISVNQRPLNPDIWYINKDIPYKHDYPTLYAVDTEPGLKVWNILNDIPYQHGFPQLIAIDERPLNPDIWYINKDIPYKHEFPKLLAVDARPLKFWDILYDIPYMHEFPEFYPVDAKPFLGWYILTDIPYMKRFPTLYPVDEKPFLGWWILNDIPYQKKFPPLYPCELLSIWYILRDIPYIKTFPPLYPIEPIPIPHYMYYFTVGTAAVGRWQVRKTRLKANMPSPEDWTLIEDLGPPSAVLSACIEADGDFDYIAGNDSITLTTTDTPWMAVITTTKKLYVKQVCADITTAILLDTGVEQASLCRGWKSDKYSVDSGLICAYRKANGVYAKVYKKVNGEYVWETLPQLLYEPVDHVEVKRLNDYRIGVYVTNPNRLLLSERFYIGGTSKTEYISVKLKPWANVCSFSMVGEPAEQTFKVERCWMEEDTKVRMHCNYPIVSYDPTYPNLTLTDDYNYSKLVEYYIQNGDLVCILDKPKYSQFNTIRIVIPDINHILYQITPQFKRTIPGGQYAVENKPVEEHINVSLSVSVGQLNMTERQNYNYTYDTEHINVDLSVSVGQLNTTEMQKLSYTYDTEHIAVDLAVSCGVLEMTQSGVTPV